MNDELKKLSIWLYANKLSLNVSKTHFIIFRSIGMRKPVYDKDLVINDEIVEQQKKTKFLGVIIDEVLSWAPHINYIKPKIAKGIGIVYKAKRLLSTETLLTLYYSFIYPYFNYALEVWGDTYNSYLQPLIRLQKRAIRTITSSGRYDHTAPLFKQLKALQLAKIHTYKIALIMFKVWHKMVPKIFASLFVRNRMTHNYNTRQELQFRVPYVGRTNYMKRAISCKGATIWNTYCTTLTIDCSFLSFKKCIKESSRECLIFIENRNIAYKLFISFHLLF